MSIKLKRIICLIVAWLAFFAALGIVDGMDRFVVPAGRGAALAITLTTVWAAGLWKAGWIRW